MGAEAGGSAQAPKQRRHHFVPRFYLDRFADPKHRVMVYERGARRSYATNMLNAAVEAGFYTVRDESGGRSEMVEEVLAEIEGIAKGIIKGIA